MAGIGSRLGTAFVLGIALVGSVLPVLGAETAAAAGTSPRSPHRDAVAGSAARTSAPSTEPSGAPATSDPDGCVPTGAPPAQGAEAVALLGDDLGVAAEGANLSASDLEHTLLTDDTLWIDGCGRPYYLEPRAPMGEGPGAAPTTTAGEADGVLPLAETFKLHSRPGALRTIYLDFDGMLIEGAGWAQLYNNGQAWTAPAYDSDGSPSTFSSAEREVIQSVWQRVSEDFAPLDIDVTTEAPGFDALDRASTADERYGATALITNDTVVGNFCNCGGQAYLGVFGDVSAQDLQPAFVVRSGVGDSPKSIAEATSHEVGHNLGLSHDGATTGCGTGGADPCGYYTGAGAWAPIMGVGYSKPLTQWSRGEYSTANNTEDDFTVMASNGGPLAADDHGDALAGATVLSGSLPLGVRGEVGTAADIDVFQFTSAGGATTFTVTPIGATPNLDAKVTVYNSAGTAVGSADPASAFSTTDVATGLGATYTSGALAAGTYYVAVDGVGAGLVATTGYSDYGSLGRYALSIAATAGPAVATSTLPASVTGVGYRANLVAAGGSTPYTWAITAGALPAGLSIGSDGSITGTPTGIASATFTVRVTDSASRTASRSLTIGPGLEVTSKNLPEASQSVAYSTTLTAAGGTAPYTWALDAGSLPSGMALSAAGVISGTSTVEGTTTATVRATDGVGLTRTQVVTVTVAAPLGVSPNTLSTGSIGVAYSGYLFAQGGRPAYIWALVSGTLPTGLRVNDNGWVKGTPTEGGTFTVTVRATDRSGRTATGTATVTINGFSFTPSTLPDATTGVAYSQTISATYATATAPLSYALTSGSLPSGYTFTNGVLAGTTAVAGSFPLTVRVTDAVGWKQTKAFTLVVRPPATLPGAPTIGTATAGNAQATVTWTAPASDGGSAITGYVVTPYIGGVAQTPVPFPSTATSQVVTGLTNATAYTFTVAATNALGTGPASAASNAVTPAALPSAPTIGTAYAGNTQATVTWTAPSSSGTFPITGYRVTATYSLFLTTSRTFTSTATSQVFTGLSNGTSYTFRVAAISDGGVGSSSGSSNSITPGTTTVPGAPSIGSATRGNASAIVTWTAPTATGGSSITGYVVTPYLGTSALSPRSFASTALSQTITGLTNGSTYTFKVAATNSTGTGPQSSASNAVTPSTVPGAPTIGTATAGDASATLAWTAPAATGGAPVTGYVVTPYIGAVAQTARTFTSTALTQEITGLANGTTYTFRVAAVNLAGTGAQSSASNAVTPSAPVVLPGAPTIGAAFPGDQQAMVTWSAPGSDGGGPITAYVVTPYVGAAAQTPQLFSSGSLVQDVVGLVNGTTYTFTVAAVNSAGAGPESGASNAVTPVGLPGAPTDVVATAGRGRATVSWAAPASDGGLPVVGYVVTPFIGATEQGSQTFASAALEQEITDLTNGTSYTFQVAAITSLGTGARSDASNAVTPRSVPMRPSSVAAIPGEGEATVLWSAPADDGGDPITGYVVTPFVGATELPSLGFSSTSTSQTITGLANGTTYTFVVAAVNGLGEGDRSDASNPATPSTVPDAPTVVDVVGGDGQVTLSWTAPAFDGGASISGYVVTPYLGAVAQPTREFEGADTSQVITGLANGTEYAFTVAAFNFRGTGPESGASSSVTPAALPGAPTIGTATSSSGQATVTWTPPASSGTYPISGYVVTPYIAAAAQTPVIAGSTATSQVVTGLLNGTTYTFTVAAVSAAGTGAGSAPSNAVMPVGVPGVPTPTSAVAGNGTATVGWTAPASDGGSPITGYVVTPFIGTVAQASQTFNSTALTQTVTGLANGTSYRFRVAAKSALGLGTRSAFSPTITVGVPAAPTGATAKPRNAAALVSWAAPTATNGAAITGYVVTPYIGAVAQAPRTFNSPALSQTVTGLTNDATYSFRVAGINARGTGPQSIGSNGAVPAVLVLTPGIGSIAEGNSGTSIINIPITMSAPSATPVTIDYATADTGAFGVSTAGVDYVATTGTVTFAPGETTKNVAITVYGDTTQEPPLLYGEWILVAFGGQTAGVSLDTSLYGLGIGVVVDDD